jgi:LPXTG-site transpeptidase (sortase) family protein
MRSRSRLWLALVVIGVSLALGFLLTRLLLRSGVTSSPMAQNARHVSQAPTPSAQGARPGSMPAAALAPTSTAVQELVPTTAVPASSRSDGEALSSATDSSGDRGTKVQTQGGQASWQTVPSLGGSGSIASGGSLAGAPLTAQEIAPFDTIGQIRIAKIELEAPIVEISWHLVEIDGQTVAEWDTHPDAVGHHRGSGPLGGEDNCVLSGHSRAAGTGSAAGVFQRLEELRSGDRIVLVDASGQEYTYLVQELTKVAELGASLEERRAHAAYMAPGQEARLTLITCWPDWAYTHRLIVTARRA